LYETNSTEVDEDALETEKRKRR